MRQIVQRIDAILSERMWEHLGRPLPPPASLKRRVPTKLVSASQAEILIETGTYLGDTVASLRGHARSIHSIELGKDLYEKARCRFAGCSDVTLWLGDSASVLPQVLRHVDARSVFWLDGHYSAGITARGPQDTPILEELSHILAADIPPYVIAIDDARCFNGTAGYPCLNELLAHVVHRRPELFCLHRLDAIYFLWNNDAALIRSVEQALLS